MSTFPLSVAWFLTLQGDTIKYEFVSGSNSWITTKKVFLLESNLWQHQAFAAWVRSCSGKLHSYIDMKTRPKLCVHSHLQRASQFRCLSPEWPPKFQASTCKKGWQGICLPQLQRQGPWGQNLLTKQFIYWRNKILT